MNDTREISRSITALVLGLDLFYRAEHDGASGSKLDTEGLVPVHWSLEQPKPINSWEDALRELQRCLGDATTLSDSWARNWLTEYVLSLQTQIRWLSGESLSYEQVVAGTLRVNPQPPGKRVLEALQHKLEQAFDNAGYSGYADYLERNLVPAADVEAVMTVLLAEARQRTEQQLPMLQLPVEPIGVTAVTGVPFTAYCDYPGQTVWINTDVPHSKAGLKHLVGHEAYPGHYAHMGHRDALVQSQDMLPDAALVVTNTASSVLFEGIAERGLDFLDWRDDPEDTIAWLHNRLQQLCSLEVAHALHTGRMTPAEAAEFLRTTCGADDAWIEGRLQFVTHRLRAPFIYAYWWGGSVVGKWWSSTSPSRRDEALRYLYSKMHSPSTLYTHWASGGVL